MVVTVEEILQAVTTISKIRDEDRIRLRGHRNELEFAFQSLQKVLEPGLQSTDPSTNGRAIQSASHTVRSPSNLDTPSSNVSGDTIPMLAGQDKAADLEAVGEGTEVQKAATKGVSNSVKEVLRLLDKKRESIFAFQYEPKACSDYDNEDIRVTIIKSVTLKRTPSDYFRAGLCAMSLADDFTDWQVQAGRPRRLDVLYNDLHDKTGSVYRAYADTCTSIEDKELAAEFIEFGIKLRFFEILCWVRYRVSTTYASEAAARSDLLPQGKPAIIYPLFFVWRSFYRCRYADLPALANTILSSQYWRDLAETKDWQPTDWQGLIATQNRKRTAAPQPCEDRSKRQRQQLESQAASESLPSLSSHGISVSDTQTVGPWIFPEKARHVTTRSIWPLGCNLFPDQPQDLASTIFPDMLRATPAPDPLTPGGLDLSTPELDSAVNEMLMTLNNNMNNQPPT
ncbi:uncharacterized protein DSM5745_07971 [Aspergillus mulundensis]|uniref:Uncharacterized protein n=1 Tax=Aspergillus mulundensis TaxID=1810919 RepID=A0A3D8R923_9EURO|nr:hypothetical protein DSM5745_07971 [Aspergillus mulundensis]RDW70460.1 hypothetical protein DSM5745_07971 [Aspergillus mulundensis]